MLFHAARTIPYRGDGQAQPLLQSPSPAGHPPDPICNQPRVGGMMNVRVDDRGILLESPSPNHFLGPEAGYDGRVERLDAVGTDTTTPVGQRCGVRQPIHHAKMAELPPMKAVRHLPHEFPIRQLVTGLEIQQPENLSGGDRGPTPHGVELVEQGFKKRWIIEQTVSCRQFGRQSPHLRWHRGR